MLSELVQEIKTSRKFAHVSPYQQLIRQATISTQKDLNADKRLITALETQVRMPLTEVLRHQEADRIYEMKQAFRKFTNLMHELLLKVYGHSAPVN